MSALLSIVTPSLNQARFLRENLYSVCSHKVSGVEHIVMDGGSTDESCDVLRCFEDQIDFWSSEQDEGQYDAINKGFARSTGAIMAWLNSDDVYFPWTIRTVLDVFEAFPEVEWLTTRHPSAIDHRGIMIRMPSTHGFDRSSFRKGFNLTGVTWPADTFIQQESTFWRRSLWDRAGAHVNASLRYAGDFDLWLRFFDHAELYAIDVPLAGFRKHADQKTSLAYAAYLREATSCLTAIGWRHPDPDVMAWELQQRRNVHGDVIVKAGLAERAPTISYDWQKACWLIGES